MAICEECKVEGAERVGTTEYGFSVGFSPEQGMRKGTFTRFFCSKRCERKHEERAHKAVGMSRGILQAHLRREHSL